MELLSLDLFSQGIAVVSSPFGFGMLLAGVIVGIIIGATPGMSPSMGVALLVPFSYGMDTSVAFLFFVATYQAANYGGSITAIAINTPGTASSVVTALDGYKLTKQGRAKEALATAVTASAVGGLIGAVLLILFALPLAQVGLSFGPAEFFSLALLGLATVIGLGGSAWILSSLAVLLGISLSMIGTDPFSGDTRFTFNLVQLYDGFALIPLMIGLFAVAEVFDQFQKLKTKGEVGSVLTKGGFEIRRIFSYWKTLITSSFIGTAVGIIPGAGATIASFLSYGIAKKRSKEAHLFGDGSHEGIIASEAANSSSVGGALVPLLALGIPGSATDAVLLGALTLHGLVAGPELFQTDPEVVYGMFVAVLLANLFVFIFGLLGNSLWLRIISIPSKILLPLIFVTCIFGSYFVKNSYFDVYTCLGFGVVGWSLKKIGVHPAMVVLGFVLGPLLELNFRRALLMDGYSLFITKPISLAFLLLALGFFLYPLVARFSGKESK
ncbi:MAG: tripartite tricarboxylate transporter permease [Deltaproteobacteria bacterium]|nr:tripartite tricarboxylate transporter permease [Deltaproteobacteria bacterium]